MVGALLIGLKIFGEKIGEEKQFEDSEHDNQLDDYQLPQSFAQRHAAKTVKVKIRDAGWIRIFHRGRPLKGQAWRNGCRQQYQRLTV